MRILVLDDQQTRHEQIRARVSHKHHIAHVLFWSDFARALGGERFDAVMLDHDLGEMVDQERKPGMYGTDGGVYDGVDAARAVASMPAERMPRIVLVHSWNHAGAKRMQWALSGCGATVAVAMFGSAAFWLVVDRIVKEADGG